ncbi:hypothetical protein [Streptomyces argyrophylli]|uniref:hypothetical protein n=1 Tax=Streptomyces argyrophylli TaxID=2726118 RepID=UPI001BB15CF4|nr:hypothetical protein [Streptomyces argyrophyllae]
MAIAPHLPSVAPRLLWHQDVAGWLLAAWEAVAGRHAGYILRADLHLVRGALEHAGGVQAPDGVELTTAVERWGPYADEGTADLFDGDTLLHTELTPGNVLLAGRRVHLVDWARPTRGAVWIDTYLWALRLMDAGHTAAAAVDWACKVPAWHAGDREAIRAFGAAVTRVWHEIATEQPTAWKLHMAVQAAELRAYLSLEPDQADCVPVAGKHEQGAPARRLRRLWSGLVGRGRPGGTVDAQVSGGYLFRFKSGSGHLPPSVSPPEPSSHHSTAARPLTSGPVRPETHAWM